MAIHVRNIDEWKRVAREAQSTQPFEADWAGGCSRCAELGAAVLVLIAEVERLRAPYARAFRDGADGALDFAARAFSAMGEQEGARVLRHLRTVTKD
jgi:hypothetical protein